jgi:hypothetical protein
MSYFLTLVGGIFIGMAIISFCQLLERKQNEKKEISARLDARIFKIEVAMRALEMEKLTEALKPK